LARGFRRSLCATLRVALPEGRAAPRLSISPLGESHIEVAGDFEQAAAGVDPTGVTSTSPFA
jgi:hypothetical protein